MKLSEKLPFYLLKSVQSLKTQFDAPVEWPQALAFVAPLRSFYAQYRSVYI